MKSVHTAAKLNSIQKLHQYTEYRNGICFDKLIIITVTQTSAKLELNHQID